jgi:hypothetical protein
MVETGALRFLYEGDRVSEEKTPEMQDWKAGRTYRLEVMSAQVGLCFACEGCSLLMIQIGGRMRESSG